MLEWPVLAEQKCSPSPPIPCRLSWSVHPIGLKSGIVCCAEDYSAREIFSRSGSSCYMQNMKSDIRHQGLCVVSSICIAQGSVRCLRLAEGRFCSIRQQSVMCNSDHDFVFKRVMNGCSAIGFGKRKARGCNLLCSTCELACLIKRYRSRQKEQQLSCSYSDCISHWAGYRL